MSMSTPIRELASETAHLVVLEARAKVKKSSVYRNRLPHMIWYVVAGVLIFLSLVNWGTWLYNYTRARYGPRKSTNGPKFQRSDEEMEKPGSGSGLPTAKPMPVGSNTTSSAPVRMIRATKATWSNVMYLRTLPLWIYSSASIVEIFWTVAYAGVTTGLVGYALVGDKRTDALGRVDFANPFGIAAYAQVPLIVGLASKNNVISFLTGISYQKLNYLHRASARICLLHSWIHTYGRITLGVGEGTEFELNHGLFIWGVIAIVGLTMSFLTSFRVIRHYLYEFFIIAHIFFVFAFLLGAFYHFKKFYQYIWPGILLWSLDRFASLCRMVWVNKAWTLLSFSSNDRKKSSGSSGSGRMAVGECTVELVDPAVMRISVRTQMCWKAGQHAYLTIPSVATLRYEQHPFTIANAHIAGQDEAIFLVRAYDGFTRKLRDALTSEKTTFKAYLDGPYGTSPSLESYDTVVLLAGGTGISFALSHLLDLLRLFPSQPSRAIRHIRLVWNVRHASHLQWIAPMLNGALTKLEASGLDLKIVVHVTRSHMADEPSDDRGVTDVVGAVAHAAETINEKVHLHGHAHGHAQAHTETSAPTAESGSQAAPDSTGVHAHVHDSNPSTRSPTLHEHLHSASSTEPSTPSSSSIHDSPASTSASSMSISENEKPRTPSLASYGLAAHAERHVNLVKGRVDLPSLLHDVVVQAQGSIHVSVCGPEELALATRRAVTDVNSARKILKGQNSIEYYGETYGW